MTTWVTKMTWFLLGAILAGLLVFLLARQRARVAPSANPPKSNNLANVDCRKHLGLTGTTRIAVNSVNGLTLEDEAVFVCTGETLHWETSDNQINDFTVDFSKGTGWPFGPGQVPLPGNLATPTPDKVVVDPPAGQRSAAYAYKLIVKRKDGSTLTVDPHIIPMGS